MQFAHVIISKMAFKTLRRCSNARSGGLRPNREHHERWVIQQLLECREAFENHLTPAAASMSPSLPLTLQSQSVPSSDVSSPGNYNIMQHAEFMISSFRARHPGLRMMRGILGSRMSLQVDRDDVVHSTVRTTLHFHSATQPQCNSNDAGCSSGCHS